ncbi:MAG: tRNA (adenosine(37)-N6)-threonylcarbamoyltransferase complex ATPase subunit type 1 TsaE [Chloroflexota bacterium]
MPIIRDGELYIISHSPEQTARLGARLGALLRPGDIVCLTGEMGAGKTLFSSGVGRGWGAQHRLTSPTYTLVHQHERDADDTLLYHLDCYRLEREADVEMLGLDDMLDDDAVLLIEWAVKIANLLPPECLWIHIRLHEVTRRKMLFEGQGDHYRELIEAFRAQTFGG